MYDVNYVYYIYTFGQQKNRTLSFDTVPRFQVNIIYMVYCKKKKMLEYK